MLGARQMWTKIWWTKILFTALSSLTLPSGTHRPRGTRCCFSKYILHPEFLCSHMGPFIQIESAPPAEPFSPRPAPTAESTIWDYFRRIIISIHAQQEGILMYGSGLKYIRDFFVDIMPPNMGAARGAAHI